MDELVMLRGGSSAMLCRVGGRPLLEVVHWGPAVGSADGPGMAAIDALTGAGSVDTKLDEQESLGVLPNPEHGYHGRFGLVCDRDGAPAAIDLVPRSSRRDGTRVEVTAVSADDVLVTLTADLDTHGTMLLEARVENHGAPGLRLTSLSLALPLPARAVESLTFTGRHGRERHPQRAAIGMGTLLQETRTGRTGHDGPYGLIVGTPGFGELSGEVWAVQLAWSGNHSLAVETSPDRHGFIGGGELLLPGEIVLAHGESYASPQLIASYSSAGLNGLSRVHHAQVRASHADRVGARPRRVEINTWEAAHFDLDLDRLTRLADTAASIGVERFVLDDGWFRGRASDRAGLGDWFVDEDRLPDGLHPLVDHVRSLGMDFGLWFEPEMVSVDSDLMRQHPDWALRPAHGVLRTSRGQVVLDLANPDVHAYLAERLESIISEYQVDFVKWDHNRDLLPSDRGRAGAAPHRQTGALYALLDRLRSTFPLLEIESCASGGGRADLGLARRTDRIWTSDANDPLERAPIQWWSSLFLPIEHLGMHVGPTRSELSSRRQDLSFRAVTALLGWTGLELDVTALAPDELDQMARWIDYHRRHRDLFHTGDLFRLDHPDAAVSALGVVDPDGGRAIFAISQVATSVRAQPAPLRFAGLDSDSTYSVRAVHPTGVPPRRSWGTVPSWYESGASGAKGWMLQDIGVALPYLHPQQAFVVEIERTG